MTQQPDTDPARPWYREPLVWLIILPPAGAVVGGFITAWLAGGPPEMVHRDESVLAIETDQGFVRDRAAVLAREAERRAEAPAAGTQAPAQ